MAPVFGTGWWMVFVILIRRSEMPMGADFDRRIRRSGFKMPVRRRRRLFDDATVYVA